MRDKLSALVANAIEEAELERQTASTREISIVISRLEEAGLWLLAERRREKGGTVAAELRAL